MASMVSAPRALVSWLVASLLMLVASCASPRTATQVMIVVDAQMGVRSETDRLVLVVRSGPAGDLSEVPDSPLEFDAPIDWARDLTLVPLGDDATRQFEVDAYAYDANGGLITVARLRGGFTEHVARTLRLTLEDRCRGIICPSGYTCRSGSCEQLVDPESDGGLDMDAGVGDAPPLPCTTDDACDDDVYCNGVERCVDGACEPGPVVVCDDGVRCTEDICTGPGCMFVPSNLDCTAAPNGVCDATTGCQYDTCDETTCVSEGCDDAACVDGVCIRTRRCASSEICCGTECAAPGCVDDDPCTDDACHPIRGCLHEPTTDECDDGNRCTVGETCRTGSCGTREMLDCADTNPCTADDCDPLTGCTHRNLDGSIDDGNVCTVGERCAAGVLVPGTTNPCDDGVACTVDSCGTTCVHTPDPSRCTAGPMPTCNPTTGCQYGSGCTGATCAPTDACETAMCSGASCVRTPVCPAGVPCCGGTCCPDDGNPCTDEVCSGTSCTHPPNTRPCDDSNACTTGDVCGGGTCRAGTPMTCTGTNPCLEYFCSGGGCTSRPQPAGTACTDGNQCTGPDTCGGGTCNPGPALTCNDGNICTADQCNPASGCIYPSALDGTPCGDFEPEGCVQPECVAGACMPQYQCTWPSLCCDGYCRNPHFCDPEF